jgi:hypothetical protein
VPDGHLVLGQIQAESRRFVKENEAKHYSGIDLCGVEPQGIPCVGKPLPLNLQDIARFQTAIREEGI